MINPTKADIGRPVFYNDRGVEIFGMLKSFNHRWVFVVFKCDNNWENFQNYTGCATERKDLTFAPEEG